MDLVRVGKVTRPHGLKGEVVFFLTSDEPEKRLKKGAPLFDGEGAKYTVKGKRDFKGQTLLSLSQVDSREKAEAMRGKELFAEAGKSSEGEIYFKDLVGLEVETEDGGKVGSVSDVFDAPQILLEVKREGEKCLIPWAKEFITQVDLKRGKIIMNLPTGLLAACSY
ncbi:MAG: 16S rRNA processing protein RimM [Aeriscardovia sp.]|nr:16S rRNA processing protein RimM [Aeriscardovia sp.]